MQKTILLTLLALSFQVSFSQSIDNKVIKDTKTKRESTFSKHLRSREYQNPVAVSAPEKEALYKKATKQKLDNIILQTNFDGKGFINSDKDEFTYDALGILSAHIYSTWNNITKQWIKDFRVDYTRGGDSAVEIIMEWDAGFNKFNNSEKTKKTYDSKNNLVNKKGYLWDLSNLEWVNVSVTDNRFNANNKIITIIDSNFLQVFKINKTEFTYDSKGNNTSTISYSWNTGTSKFDNLQKTENTFDANNRKIMTLYMSWNKNLNTWESGQKNDYTNDANGNVLTSTNYNWDKASNSYIVAYKENNTYDSKGNLTSNISLYWDEDEEAWINEFKTEYSFDINIPYDQLILPFDKETIIAEYKTKPTQMNEYYWDDFDNVWANDTRTTYNFSNVGGSGSTKDIAASVIEVFPNPASGKVYIKLQNHSGNLSVKIYDITGKVVQSGDLSGKSFISVEGLKKGVYMLQIMEGQTLQGNRKLVIE